MPWITGRASAKSSTKRAIGPIDCARVVDGVEIARKVAGERHTPRRRFEAGDAALGRRLADAAA